MRIVVNVVMSSEMRVPVLSLAKGRVGRYETTYRGPEEAFTITVEEDDMNSVGVLRVKVLICKKI